jgi:hypothetical protein
MSAVRRPTDEQVLRYWIGEVSNAAALLERRWTRAALKRVDPDVAKRLEEQRDLFDRAAVTGTVEEIERHGAALCRGYAVAVKTLENAQEPDGAYLLGQDPRSGFTVAIGNQKPAAERVQEVHGRAAVWISPDEVAAILSGLGAFKTLTTIKRMFPGAEVIDIRPREPAKAESGIDA